METNTRNRTKKLEKVESMKLNHRMSAVSIFCIVGDKCILYVYIVLAPEL